jgi:hypothetical protein
VKTKRGCHDKNLGTTVLVDQHNDGGDDRHVWSTGGIVTGWGKSK